MVVSFYFGSSAFKEQKDKLDKLKDIQSQAIDEEIGGGGPRNPNKP